MYIKSKENSIIDISNSYYTYIQFSIHTFIIHITIHTYILLHFHTYKHIHS